MRVCPFCNNIYEEYPALSRRDNKTDICPDFGKIEALEDMMYHMMREGEEDEDR